MLARTSWISDISVKASGKRTKIVGNPNWRKDNYWSGSFRSSLYEAPTVKYRPLIRSAQRQALVVLVTRFMSQWRSSPWEMEGTARRQLRNHFIRLGHSWDLSDLEAAKIIETALARMGHQQRPSWEDGQPEALRTDGVCLQCGQPVQTMPGRAATAFFCYPVTGRVPCEERYNSHRDSVFKASQTAAAQRLYKQAFIKSQPAKPCEHCRKPFKGYEQRFCSHECATAASIEIQPRGCACCGAKFKPVNLSGPRRYCSVECSAKGRTTSSMIPCEECGTSFKVYRSRPKRFCSVPCYRAAEAKAKASDHHR